MRRADRLFRLLLALRGGRLVTARRLAELMEVSERTIYRDVADLQSSGVPIDGEAGLGYLLRDFELPPLMFSRAEVEALALGAAMVQSWGGHEVARAAAGALEKIRAVLPEALNRKMDQRPFHAVGYQVPDGLRSDLDRLARAIQDRRLADIDYEALDGRRSRRRIRPLGLHFWGGVWTLTGWCELRGDFRNFRVDRLRGLDVLVGNFTDEPGRTLADFLSRLCEP
ncbi:MAG TPA: YafY family protein [Candidatus Sulfotelmatobacter sp.]|jgi:predicted DNA-binding transcriptional regulator YafY|nr:YafY family protein [Candidatus Sulfotelmatobacter sp.]